MNWRRYKRTKNVNQYMLNDHYKGQNLENIFNGEQVQLMCKLQRFYRRRYYSKFRKYRQVVRSNNLQKCLFRRIVLSQKYLNSTNLECQLLKSTKNYERAQLTMDHYFFNEQSRLMTDLDNRCKAIAKQQFALFDESHWEFN